jgi:hypothetical protein
MHENPREGPDLSLPPPAAARPGPQGDSKETTFQPYFAKVAPSRSEITPRSERGSLTRTVLPALLVVAIIGGIAWVTQYMPSWRTGRQQIKDDGSGPPASTQRAIHFAQTSPVWDKDDPEYILEWERGVKGHYDYVFTNKSDEPVELGLEYSACDCSSVTIASTTSSEEWQAYQQEKIGRGPGDEPAGKGSSWSKPLQVPLKDPKSFVVVPAKANGVARLSWESRKQTGNKLELRIRFWMQPQGKPSLKNLSENIDTPVLIVPPIVYREERLDLGAIGGQEFNRAEFLCWSSTRPSVNLTVPTPADDPNFVCTATPLSAESVKAIEKRLRGDGVNTRIKVGFRVSVAVYEQRKGKILDQGPFQRRVPLFVDGEPQDPQGPLVVGQVRGEVQIGTGDDQGKVQLKTFRVSDGTRTVIGLRAPRGTELKLESHQPSYLQVKLLPDGKDTTGTRARWRLEVTVPPNTPAGPLPEDGAIILRTLGTPPRFIRVPVLGNALQG